MNRRHSSTALVAGILSAAALAQADPLAPERHRYAVGHSAPDIPIEMIGGHPAVPVRINGSRELRFTLDSGIPFKGIDLFHQALADELVPASGRVDFSLPGIIFFDQKAVSLSNEHLEQAPEAGLIGLTLFASCIVEIDFAAARLGLFDPAVHDDSGLGDALEIVFVCGLPCVEVGISLGGEDARLGLFAIDLGNPGALLVLPGGVCRIEPPSAGAEVVLGAMASGEIRGVVGHVSSLRLGSHVLREVPARFASRRYLGGDAPELTGCIGNGLLERFTITFDYSGRRLLL